ncbi:right-handed parallel beta-helix repeat-containing protein [Terrimonas pollutisoli]|uniref:right-handed parallel beta-helix repeat-containing protein n=1 Tax=Terrimonas pollutisoli TaxID=3034147 RepID=UPI0023EDCB25|nr:right-handed parallel beta-helix repeat-containing protein [Terrimonas sp. H1YJ31]
MFLHLKFFRLQTLVTFVSLALFLVSCGKSLEYKRRNPISPTPNSPTPNNPAPTPAPTTINYLALPKAGPKFIYQQSNVVIENLQFEHSGRMSIYIKKSSNITVRNCFFNKSALEAINVESSSNITIENCLFNDAQSGVYVMQSQVIKVVNNQFVNVRKREDGSRGQFVQFNQVAGEGNIIENNRGENFLNESNPEDLISLYMSNGTAASPIMVRNNIFRGGGPSISGGGIMTGDLGGSYFIVENNTLVDPGQYGIAIAGGSNITILNNKIYGRQQPFTNNPLYVWAQTGIACSDINVKGNKINWTDKTGYMNMGWNAGNCAGTLWEPPVVISLEEMNVPSHLITFITPEELLQIRKQ